MRGAVCRGVQCAALKRKLGRRARLAPLRRLLAHTRLLRPARHSEEEIVGFALGQVEQWATSRHFLLREICVALQMQRRGVGSQLMQALEDHLREAGIERIVLHTAREGNAQAFYNRCGFHTSARMVMMSKRLAPDG